MTVAGFIELTGGADGLPILVRVAEIALVRQAGQAIDDTKTIIILRSGVIVPVATEFSNVAKRIATPTNSLKGT